MFRTYTPLPKYFISTNNGYMALSYCLNYKTAKINFLKKHVL